MTCKHCGRMDPYSASCDVCEKPKPPPPCDRCGKSECVCNLHPSETAPSEPNYDHMSTQLKPTPERRIACPKCEGANILVERRPNGNCACVDCAHIWPTALSYKFKSAPECPGGDKHWMDPSIGGFSSCVKCGHTEYPDDRPAKESGGREMRVQYSGLRMGKSMQMAMDLAEKARQFTSVKIEVMPHEEFEQMKRERWVVRVSEECDEARAQVERLSVETSNLKKQLNFWQERAEKAEALCESQALHVECGWEVQGKRALAALEYAKKHLTDIRHFAEADEIARLMGEPNAGEG